MIGALFLLQAIVAPPPADITFHATVRARSLTIEKQGEARLTVRANGQNLVKVEAPRANGRKTIRNPVVRVNVEARIAAPETGPPQPE